MASDIFISETNNICISKRLQCQSPIFHIFFEKMNRTKIVNWLQIRIFFDTMFCDMVSNLVCCNIQHSSEWETMVNYLEEMVNKNIQRHSPSVQGDFAPETESVQSEITDSSFFKSKLQLYSNTKPEIITNTIFAVFNNSIVWFLFLFNQSKLHCN